MNETLPPPEVASFNLWRDPWIRVLALDGVRRTLSIEEALLQAHTLKALYDPSPLVVCGIHRLLTAILQAIYAPEGLTDIGDVLDEQQFAAVRVGAFAARYAPRFELFDPTAPFLQTGDIPLDAWRKPEKATGKQVAPESSVSTPPAGKIEPKSVAYLLPEVPAGTNRTHFRHVADDDHRLCPACCARGLVTIPAFATSGGAGIKPSINGVPPVYLLPVGDTLFHSLALSLIGENYQPTIADAARPTAWSGISTIPRNGDLVTVGYLESLTFPARRVRLFPLHDAGPCTHCGRLSPIRVKDMLFEMGLSRSKVAGLWKDPFVAYRMPPKAKSGEEPTPLRPNRGKALWRDYSALFLADAELQPALMRQMIGLAEESIVTAHQRLRFRCIGMKTDGKAKIFEWIDDALDVPPALLHDKRGAAAVREALRRAEECMRSTRFIFSQHMKPEPNAKRDRFVLIRGRMEDDYWTALALPFRDFIAVAATPEDVDQVRARWARRILAESERVFTSALNQIGDRADQMRRRVEAQSHCRRVLAKLRKDWNSE